MSTRLKKYREAIETVQNETKMIDTYYRRFDHKDRFYIWVARVRGMIDALKTTLLIDDEITEDEYNEFEKSLSTASSMLTTTTEYYETLYNNEWHGELK